MLFSTLDLNLMLIYLSKTTTTVAAVYISVISYYMHSYATESLFLIDLLNRLNLDLFNWDTAYILWTNIKYLYLYFVPLIFILLQVASWSYVKRDYLSYIITMISTSIVCACLVISSNYSVHYSEVLNSSNFLLVNSINKYHPFILHYCLNFFLVFYLSKLALPSLAKSTVASYSNFSFIINILNLCILTMIFGSWWAYQEGSWGGWWAWDQSEVFGLIILLSLTVTTHYSFFSKKFLVYNRIFKVITLAVLVVYTLLQSNFGITSHNFGLRDESDFLYKAYCLTLLITLISYCAYHNKLELRLVAAKFKLSLYVSRNLKPFITIFTIIIIFNLLVLLTDLAWKTLAVNLVNVSINYYLAMSLVILVTIIYYGITTKYVLLYSLICIGLIVLSPYLFLISNFFFINLPLSTFFIFHTSILAAIDMSNTSSNYYCASWLYTTNQIDTIISKSSVLYSQLLFVSHPFFDKAGIIGALPSNSSALSSSSTLEMPLFSLKYLGYGLSQTLLSDTGRLSFSNIISDNFTQIILLISTYLLYKLKLNSSIYYIIKC